MFVTELSFSSAILKEEQVGKGMIELFYVEDDPQIPSLVLLDWERKKEETGYGDFKMHGSP